MDKLNQMQSEYHTKEFRVAKLEKELEVMSQKQNYASYQLREMEELNNQNKGLLDEVKNLQAKYEELRLQGPLPMPSEIPADVIASLAQRDDELRVIQEKMLQLQQEVQKHQGQPHFTIIASQ